MKTSFNKENILSNFYESTTMDILERLNTEMIFDGHLFTVDYENRQLHCDYKLLKFNWSEKELNEMELNLEDDLYQNIKKGVIKILKERIKHGKNNG